MLTRPKITFVLLLVFSVCGCEQNSVPDAFRSPSATMDTSRQQDLKQGLSFLNRLDEFDQAEVQQKILYHLSQWMKRQSADPNWSPDALVLDSGMVAPGDLAPLQLNPYDMQVLQEATWLRDVSRTVVESNTPSPDIQRVIDASVERVGESTGGDLAHAIQLFDWTVRNLMLDHDFEVGETLRQQPIVLEAWECLLLGRGTAMEKSRVFMLLARQLGLPAVLLGVEDESAVKPWLTAVLLGDQLFLFDMILGMPVLDETGAVATLEQVLEKPEILVEVASQAGVEVAFTAEQIRAGDPNSIVAVIDATPGYLSQRMQLLEKQLMGDEKMVLSVAPASIAGRLINSGQINSVGIWGLPYEGFMIRSEIQQQPQLLRWLTAEHGIYDGSTPFPLRQARLLHLRGQFDKTDDAFGARQLYLECRPSNTNIEQIGEQLVKQVETSEATPAQIEEYRGRIEAIFERIKLNASFWLGTIAFERGEYQSASRYFQTRVLESASENRWTSTAKYNLGRCWEAIAIRDNDLDAKYKAIEIYRSVIDSPWTPICTLRASWLEQ